jgi:uncharacterized protein
MLSANQKIKTNLYYLPLVLLPIWIIIYLFLNPAVNYIIDHILSMSAGNRFTESLRFFLFEFPKVLLLLILIIFISGIIRSYFSPEKTRKLLEGKSLFAGNIMAGLLGIVTPFCSCSAIPLFLGFVETGIPLGVTFSFLIAAPMINEVAVVLLFGMFGWKIATIYIITGLTIAISTGWIIGKINPTRWVESWVYETKAGQASMEDQKIRFKDRISFGFQAVKEIVGKVWIYIAIGIAVGAGAHGYVPQDFMASIMGKSVWYAVPISVLIGIPLYSNAAGILPIVSVLIEKGASLGTALAFMMSVIGLSLPEMIILRKVIKIPLLLIFVGVISVGIILVGYLFNLLKL